MPRRTPSAGDARNARARGAASRREARTRANALHPELSRQVREVVAAADGTPVAIDDLLARISRHYVELEQERRTLSRALRRAATRGPAPPAAASPVSASPSPPSSAEGEARYRSLVEHAPEAIVVFDAGSGLLVDANLNAEALFGQPVSALLGRRLLDFAPARQPDGQDTAGLLQAQASRALAGEPRVFDWVHGAGEGADLACEMRLARLPDAGGRALVRCSLTDISTRRRAQLIAAGERAVLENVAANAPLERSLEAIAGLVESVARDGIAVVSVVSVEHPRFELVCAPRLPAVLRAVLDRATIDIRNGSCAACVQLGRPVLAGDAPADPHWRTRREALLAAGVRATWSVPIRGASGRILGALGCFRAQAGAPDRETLQLLEDAARLAGIAIDRRRAEEALRGSEAKFRGLFESVMEGVYQSSIGGRLISVNPAFVEILGYRSAEELYALPSVAMLYWNPADRGEFARRLEAGGEVRNAEFALRRRDGQQIVVLESARAVRDAEGRTLAYEGTISDITARKRAEQAIFQEKERAQVTLQSIGDAVITADAEGRIDYMNPVAEQLTRWSLQDAQGRSIGEVLRLVDDAGNGPLENPLLRALRSGASVGPSDRAALLDRDGREKAIQDSAAPIRDRGGRVVGAVVTFRDVTRERRLRKALAFQATHDALTGLINRREFDVRLHAALQRARDGGRTHAVLYVDLDQFKVVNDTCGHSAGDRLIREITALLQARVRASDVIARLGGDEFGVLLEDCTLDQAGVIAESVRQGVRDHRFVWEGSLHSVGASIGVVEITPQTESVAALLSAADVACYSAKDQGRNRIQVYEGGHGEQRHREMKWVAQIARAAEEGRFELVGQGIRALRTGLEPRFFELMVRMRDEDGRLVPPGEFIPAAERYNVMPTIDYWVIDEAVRVLASIPAGRPRPLLAVNVSGTSLSDPGYLERVVTLLRDPELARCVCFEVTETAAVASLDGAIDFMRELKGRGCR
ncbi:MAG: diguanylate cyclase, partial [Steroidobacteraceae bacterium]